MKREKRQGLYVVILAFLMVFTNNYVKILKDSIFLEYAGVVILLFLACQNVILRGKIIIRICKDWKVINFKYIFKI